jgi:zinc protease
MKIAAGLGMILLSVSGRALADNPSKYVVLDNGLRVILYEKRSLPLVNVSLAINVGAKDEAEGRSGLVHLLEHCLLFHGRSDGDGSGFSGEFRRNGAYFNGYTNQDLSIFEVSLPSDRSLFALGTLGGILSAFEISKEDLEREKEIILEEIGTFRDDPRRYAASLVYETLFRGHAYRNPIFGDGETIRTASADALARLHASYFVPANSALAVVGDFAIREMEAAVRAVFGGLPPGSPNNAVFPKAAVLDKRVEIRQEMDVGEAYLAIGFVGPDYDHPDRFAAEILTEIMGRGVNPLLNSALRSRRDLVQTVTMNYAALKSGGVFLALFTLAPRDLSQAKGEAIQFLKKARGLNYAREDYVGADQYFVFDFLRGAKNDVRYGAQRGRESGLLLADSLARHALLVDAGKVTESYLAGIDRVDSTKLRQVAARYLSQGESVVVEILPVKNK